MGGVHGDAGRKVGHVYTRTLHGVILPDHASYGPEVSMVCNQAVEHNMATFSELFLVAHCQERLSRD